MKKIIYPGSKEQIKDCIDLIDGFIIGIDGLSVNTVLNIDVKNIDDYLSFNKEVFVSLNKNMFNSDLDKLEEVLMYLNNKGIKGVLFYDLSVLNIVKRLNLNINLIWSQEHLTNNYLTCNYYFEKGVKGVNISSEITLKEILEIKENTNLELFVLVFGYIPMFNSKRHIVNNYLETYNFSKNSNLYYMSKDGKNYPLVDDNLGTTAYNYNILWGFEETDIFKEKGIDYIVLNSFNIDCDKFKKVLEIFNHKLDSNSIYKMFDNLDKGFLYKETIYKVKKDDK